MAILNIVAILVAAFGIVQPLPQQLEAKSVNLFNLNPPAVLDPIKLAIDMASAAVLQASEDAKRAADAAAQQVEGVVALIEGAAKQAQTDALAEMSKIGGGVQATTQAALAVLGPNPNTTACTANIGTDIANLIVEGGQSVISCFTDKLQEARNILVDVLALGKAALELGPNTIAGLVDCTKVEFFSQLGCVAKVANVATTSAVNIGVNVTANIIKATNLVANLERDLTVCTVMKIFGFVIKTGEVTINVGMCVVKTLAGVK